MDCSLFEGEEVPLRSSNKKQSGRDSFTESKLEELSRVL